MPTYVYECSKCDQEIEVWQSFSEDPLKRHSGCGGKLTKVLQPVGIVLKGPGFYKTDSRNGKSSRPTADGAASESKSDSSSSTTESGSGSGSSGSSGASGSSGSGSKKDAKSGGSKSSPAKTSKTPSSA